TNGREGWEGISTRKPDIVLSDIAMPEMDGVELCRRIKTTESTSDIPVIMFTSLKEAEIQLAGTSAGADAYLSKDTDPRILKARIEALLASRTRQSESTEKRVDSARRQTLSQTVVTLAHHLNNSLISMHATASVVNPDNTSDSRKLRDVCITETRKMLVVLKALKQMADERELKTTVYVGSEVMFDLETELARLADATEKPS
ncbi:MAG TPA: response regulator, partial [Firmicutes bacterium]|nr:response regulator [Bacillota bacterium]